MSPITQYEAMVLILPMLMIGALIGLTGIGGILVVPAIITTSALPFDVAVRLALGTFFFTGLAGSASLVIQERGQERPIELIISAFPGTIMGLIMARYLPVGLMLTALSLLAISSGVSTFLPMNSKGRRYKQLNVSPVFLGIFVGFGSAVTGTGGPILLTPVLTLMGLGARQVITQAQFIQLPIGAVGLVAAFAHGLNTGALAVALGILLSFGALIGNRYAQLATDLLLRRILGLILLVYGIYQLVRLLFSV